jgi:hypothetical protein
VVGVQDIIDGGKQRAIIDHARQSMPDPVAGLGPGGSRWQPSRGVVLRDASVLLDQRRSDGPADAARQEGVRDGPPVESHTGHGSAEIPPLLRLKQQAGHLEGAARDDEAQDAPFADEALAASRMRWEPGQPPVRQRCEATILASLDAKLRRREHDSGFVQGGTGSLRGEHHAAVRHAIVSQRRRCARSGTGRFAAAIGGRRRHA